VGFQILQVSLAVGRIRPSLKGERGCLCQREEALRGDRVTGNVVGKEGKGEAARSREEVLE